MPKTKRLTPPAFDVAPLTGTPMTRALGEFTEKQRARLVKVQEQRKAGETVKPGAAKLWAQYENRLALEERRASLRDMPRTLVCEAAANIPTNQLAIWREYFGVDGLEGESINLAKVLTWLRRDLAERHSAAPVVDGSERDPLLATGGSPALEEYRKWKARLAELDVRTREADLLDREQVRAMLLTVAQVIRQGCDTLQRQHGPDAYDIMSEALEEADRAVVAFFESVEADAEGQPALPAHSGN